MNKALIQCSTYEDKLVQDNIAREDLVIPSGGAFICNSELPQHSVQPLNGAFNPPHRSIEFLVANGILVANEAHLGEIAFQLRVLLRCVRSLRGLDGRNHLCAIQTQFGLRRNRLARVWIIHGAP